MQCKSMRHNLWLAINVQRGGKMLKPSAPYVLMLNEFYIFETIIENLQTPSGCVLAMGKYIKMKNFGSLKSHDYHVLMQQFLPLRLRGLLIGRPQMDVKRFSRIFRQIVTRFHYNKRCPCTPSDFIGF